MTKSADHPADRFFGIWGQMRRGPMVRDLKRMFQPDPGPSLSGSEIDVIQALASRSRGCGMTELTMLVAADAGNLTRTIAQLVAKDCVRRLADRADARERVVELSPLGRQLAMRQSAVRRALFDAALGHLSAQRREQLLDDLEVALVAMRGLALAEAPSVPAPPVPSGAKRESLVLRDEIAGEGAAMR